MLELRILLMLLVLLSMVCKRRFYCDILQTYNSIGGANLSTVVNARGVCIRNVGNGPLRFSKLGFYQTTEDAQSNQRELLDQSLAIAISAELGPDPQAGEGLNLSGRIGAVAKALHQLEIVIICLALAC